jgi:hypothetical protein
MRIKMSFRHRTLLRQRLFIVGYVATKLLIIDDPRKPWQYKKKYMAFSGFAKDGKRCCERSPFGV